MGVSGLVLGMFGALLMAASNTVVEYEQNYTTDADLPGGAGEAARSLEPLQRSPVRFVKTIERFEGDLARDWCAPEVHSQTNCTCVP